MVEIKHKEFIDVVAIMSCQLCPYVMLSWKMGLRIYGERTTQIPFSLPTMIDPLAQERE